MQCRGVGGSAKRIFLYAAAAESTSKAYCCWDHCIRAVSITSRHGHGSILECVSYLAAIISYEYGRLPRLVWPDMCTGVPSQADFLEQNVGFGRN